MNDLKTLSLYQVLSKIGYVPHGKAVLDAADTAFVLRELDHVQVRTFDAVYAPIKARMLIPVNREVPAGASQFTAESWDQVGQAKIVANWADDLPSVETFRRSISYPTRYLADQYEYSIQDLQASQMSGISLDARRAQAAKQSIENKIDQIAATGDATSGLRGILNLAGVPIFALPTGSWATATDAQILEDLRAFAQSIVDQTRTSQPPDTIVVDPVSYGRLQRTIGADFNTTLLRAFLSTNPYIKAIEQWTSCETANPTNGRRLLCYSKNPNMVELYMLSEFTALAPQEKGLMLRVPCYAKTGGVVAHYPLSLAYADNS